MPGRRASLECSLTSYVVVVDDWSARYSFGERLLDDSSRFLESLAFTLSGRLQRPTVLGVEHVSCKIMTLDIDVDGERRTAGGPSMIGSMRKSRSTLHADLTCPARSAAAIMSGLSAGKFGTLILIGRPLFRSRAEIASFTLEASQPRAVGPDEYEFIQL